MNDDGSGKKLDPGTEEAWSYLLEVVDDYERYIGQIGNLGFTAPNLLYYRDEIQEMLDEFGLDPRVDTREIWAKIRGLDLLMRARQVDLVAEIGHVNFKQYQIINDPPRTHWWWFLNRIVAAPPAPPRPFWQFWKAPGTKNAPPKSGDAPPAADEEPKEFKLEDT